VRQLRDDGQLWLRNSVQARAAEEVDSGQIRSTSEMHRVTSTHPAVDLVDHRCVAAGKKDLWCHDIAGATQTLFPTESGASDQI